MTRSASPSFADDAVALMGAGLPEVAQGAEAPDWIHLLPAGAIATKDSRGPYTMSDAQTVIQASLHAGDKLPVDENHATDLAAPLGLPAPARGWIVELQARTDGIWGRVDWTDEGRALVKGSAYRAISPVIRHDGKKRVVSILRASLVNKPNLVGLTTLNMETQVSLQSEIIKILKLPEAASVEDILAALKKEMADDPGEGSVATQAQIDEVGAVLGLPAGKPIGELLVAAKASKLAKPAEIVALQSELAEVSGKLKTLMGDTAREKATAFVDGAIRAGTVGVKGLRDHYIEQHMQNPERVEKEIGGLPRLGASGTLSTPPAAAKDGEVALNAEQSIAARALGIDPKAYAATLKSERVNEEAL